MNNKRIIFVIKIAFLRLMDNSEIDYTLAETAIKKQNYTVIRSDLTVPLRVFPNCSIGAFDL